MLELGLLVEPRVKADVAPDTLDSVASTAISTAGRRSAARGGCGINGALSVVLPPAAVTSIAWLSSPVEQ